MVDGEWLTVEELAMEIGVPIRTVRTWRANGSGPRAHRFGKRLKFRRRDIEAWYETRAERRLETSGAA